MDKMERKFPLGLALSRKEVVYGNLDFLNGRKGAHINISGVSGIATKTTYTTFLLHSLLHCGALEDPANTHAIIFNVKGEDLLFLDKKNNALSPTDLVEYDQMGLPPEPFDSVQFYVPPVENTKGPLSPRVGARKADEVVPYFWTVRHFCRERLLRYLFTDAGEDSSLLIHVGVSGRASAERSGRRGGQTRTGPRRLSSTGEKGERGKRTRGRRERRNDEVRDFPTLVRALESLASSTGQTQEGPSGRLCDGSTAPKTRCRQ